MYVCTYVRYVDILYAWGGWQRGSGFLGNLVVVVVVTLKRPSATWSHGQAYSINCHTAVVNCATYIILSLRFLDVAINCGKFSFRFKRFAKLFILYVGLSKKFANISVEF